MRIGLDARTLVSSNRRGIGKAMLRLYQHLQADHPDWEVLAYHRSVGPIPDDLPANFKPVHIEIPGDRFDAWTQLRLPAAARLDGVDVLHCPANLCPRWMSVPTVVTVHDLIPLDLPQGRSSLELRRFEQSIAAACEHATAVVTPSRYTCNRLIHEHKLDARRGIVVPWAVTLGSDTIDIHKAEDIVRRYGIDRGYLLHFGAAEPRKNTKELIGAWAMVRRTYRQYWRLVIVGLDEKTMADCRKLAQSLGIEKDLVLLGFVPEKELPLLLTCASVLVYPSQSEGFGLPILEAFATATAVICSDTTSLPEVAGDAALLVPPDSATSLATAMTQLLKDPMRRSDLVQRGSRRLSKFRWHTAAERFAATLDAASRIRRERTRPAAA